MKRPIQISPGKSMMIAVALGLACLPAPARSADSTALFIVADAAAMNTGETNVLYRLEDMGFFVTAVGQNDVSDALADGMSIVLISATVSSGTIATNLSGLRDLPMPVMNWEPGLYDDQGFQAAAGSEFSTSVVRIVRTDHPLAAALPLGEALIVNADIGVSYGTPEGEPIIIAVNPNDSTQVVHFGYEKGALMASDPAPARRVGTFLLNNVAGDMTEEAWALFDSAVVWLMQPATPDAVRERPDGVPFGFTLRNNYPNPFNPSTRIAFSIRAEENVRLSVWNALGEEIAVLIDGVRPAGEYEAFFDAAGLATGILFYRLETGSGVLTKKMMVLK